MPILVAFGIDLSPPIKVDQDAVHSQTTGNPMIGD